MKKGETTLVKITLTLNNEVSEDLLKQVFGYINFLKKENIDQIYIDYAFKTYLNYIYSEKYGVKDTITNLIDKVKYDPIENIMALERVIFNTEKNYFKVSLTNLDFFGKIQSGKCLDNFRVLEPDK